MHLYVIGNQWIAIIRWATYNVAISGSFIIIICEITSTYKTFVIDQAYATQLQNKLAIFKEKTKTNKQIFLCLISANGVRKNRYFTDLIHSTVTLDDLFIAEQ